MRQDAARRRALRAAVIVLATLLAASLGVSAFQLLRPAGASTAHEAPLWKPGYRWTYQVRGTGIDEGSAQVTVVHSYACLDLPCGYQVRASQETDSGKDGEFAAVDKDDLGWRERTDAFWHPSLPFPLDAGRRGTIDGYTFEVTYAGMVRVQGGAFVAHRVTYSDGDSAIQVVYAPAVRAAILVESRVSEQTAQGTVATHRVAELTSHRI